MGRKLQNILPHISKLIKGVICGLPPVICGVFWSWESDLRYSGRPDRLHRYPCPHFYEFSAWFFSFQYISSNWWGD